jgi:hypothetical protein
LESIQDNKPDSIKFSIDKSNHPKTISGPENVPVDFSAMSPKQRKKRTDELWNILRGNVAKLKKNKFNLCEIVELDEPHIELIDEREVTEEKD